MARMNISIPDDVKSDIDGISGINWSAVATEAFRSVVLNHKAKVTDMNAVVDRLRACKQRYETEEKQFGEEYGRKWAAETAEFEELTKLDDLTEIPQELDDLYDLISPKVGNHPRANLVRDVGRSEFLESVFVNDDPWSHDNPEFCAGFVDGALSVFNEVKDQL